MTRWFKLTRSTTYSWKSKASGKQYVFAGEGIVPVDHPSDQERFLRMPERLVEVDQKGNVIDSKTGQTLPAAFSRHGMVQPKSYAKVTKAPAAKPVPPRPEPAPRTVVSSTKAAAPSAPEAPAETAPPAQPAPEPEVSAEKAQAQPEADDASTSSDDSGDASSDSEPKTRTKKSSKKSGRKGDE